MIINFTAAAAYSLSPSQLVKSVAKINTIDFESSQVVVLYSLMI